MAAAAPQAVVAAAAPQAAVAAADSAVLSVQLYVTDQGQPGAAGMALADSHQVAESGVTVTSGEEEEREAEGCC